jgi:hypothetical protein
MSMARISVNELDVEHNESAAAGHKRVHQACLRRCIGHVKPQSSSIYLARQKSCSAVLLYCLLGLSSALVSCPNVYQSVSRWLVWFCDPLYWHCAPAAATSVDGDDSCTAAAPSTVLLAEQSRPFSRTGCPTPAYLQKTSKQAFITAARQSSDLHQHPAWQQRQQQQ